MLKLTVGPHVFLADLHEALAPDTVANIRKLLPLRDRVIHARWSGEATWVPFGADYDLDLDFENATCHPSSGELLLFRGGPSEVEILFPYGNARFSSKAGDLAGNHFATVVEGRENLPELGRLTLWEGAQDILIEEV